MRIEQEKIPSAEELCKPYKKHLIENVHNIPNFSGTGIFIGDVYEVMKDYLKLHLKAIRYEYDQYQFFLDAYSKGSASISEVREAHNRFIKLLE